MSASACGALLIVVACVSFGLGATFGTLFPSYSATEKISRWAVERDRCEHGRGGEWRDGKCWTKAVEMKP